MLLGVVLAGVVIAAIMFWSPDKNREILESQYAKPPDTFVSVLGLRVRVRESGRSEAPAVILLHGFGASLDTWDKWASSLLADFRVIRFDLPGAGLTGADPTGNYSDVRGMQVLTALMDKLRIPRATLVGHSMGGRLAWRYAADNPGRVDKLVLVSPDGFASEGFDYGKAPEVPATFKLMPYFFPKFMVRMSLEPAYANSSFLTDELISRYYDLMLAPGVRKAMIAKLEQSILPDPIPLLKRIEAPTLLIWGDKDAMIPIANAADYVRTLVKSTLITVPGVGHLAHEEASDATIVAVKEFLGK